MEDEIVDYTNLDDDKRLKLLRDQLQAEIYKAGDFNPSITNRKIQIWQKEGLLMELREKGKWRRFNFVEYCWINIVSDLREFEIKYDTIRKLKEQLLSTEEWLLLLEYPETLKEILETLPEDKQQELKKWIGEKDKLSERSKALNISTFFLMIFTSIWERYHLTIIFDKEGNWEMLKNHKREVQLDKLLPDSLINRHYFSLSVTQIISRILLEFYFGSLKIELDILTPQEEDILKLVREGKYKKITVKFKDNQVELIEATSGKTYLDAAARISDLILSGGFQDINIVTQKGKIVYYENTKKIKY